MAGLPKQFALTAEIKLQVQIPLKLETCQDAPARCEIKAPPEAMETFSAAMSELATWAKKHQYLIASCEVV